MGEFDSHFRLKDKLDPIRELYDYVVIDTPPDARDPDGQRPRRCDAPPGARSSPRTSPSRGPTTSSRPTRRSAPAPTRTSQFLGVVITLHDRRTVLARDIQRQIRDVFGEKVFRTTISKSVRLEESPAYKQSIFTFAPTSSGATEYYSLSEEVIARV